MYHCDAHGLAPVLEYEDILYPGNGAELPVALLPVVNQSRDVFEGQLGEGYVVLRRVKGDLAFPEGRPYRYQVVACLLYTSDAADDLLCVDLGGRRIIK